jgi:hypothetical protein
MRNSPIHLCRLRYCGNDEWLFTGAEKVNGTVTGAMKAGMAAYAM